MSNPECVRYTRPCRFGDCGQDAAYVMYEYLGNYRWHTDQTQRLYACADHAEQLAALHHVTASDIHAYDDTVPF